MEFQLLRLLCTYIPGGAKGVRYCFVIVEHRVSDFAAPYIYIHALFTDAVFFFFFLLSLGG